MKNNSENLKLKYLKKSDKPVKKKETAKHSKESHKKEEPKKKKGFFKRFLKVLLIIFLVLVILGIGFTVWGYNYIKNNAPEVTEEALYESLPSIIYDSEGNEIQKLGTEWRTYVTYDKIPDVMVDALYAIEDSRFLYHNGVDLPRLVKAILDSIRHGDFGAAGGGSTITMQLAKQAYIPEQVPAEINQMEGIKGKVLRTLKKVEYKFTQMYLAVFELERRFTKEQIVEFYLNRHTFGDNRASGIEEASKFYFGKSAKDLTLPEAAMLAGLMQAPGDDRPFLYPERAEERRQEVLYQMLNHGYINEIEYEAAMDITIQELLVVPSTRESIYQDYIDTVVSEVIEKTGLNPYNTALKIYTNMDTSLQEYIYELENGNVLFEWPNEVLQMGVVITDTQTGEVVAVGAGRNRDGSRTYNFATDSQRQPGSTAKPLFDYAPLIEYENASTYTPFFDEPYKYTGTTIQIRNWDEQYRGFYTMRRALVTSRNIPALKAFQMNVNENIVEFVTSLGINTFDPVEQVEETGRFHEAFSLGGFKGTNPMQMAGAYQAFGNGGYYIKPYTVSYIIDRNTQEKQDLTPVKEKVMEEHTAYMISDMLVDYTTYRGADGLGGTYFYMKDEMIAMKSGTTNLDTETKEKYSLPAGTPNDAWAMAYSPNYTVAFWLGYEQISSEYYLPSTVYKIRNPLVKSILENVMPQDGKTFEKPDDVVEVTVEYGSYPAMLPSENTPEDMRVKELFIKGTEPTEVSPRYQSLPDVTNLRAEYVGGSLILRWDSPANAGGMNRDYLYNLMKENRFFTYNFDEQFNAYYNTNGVAGYDVHSDGTYIGFVTGNEANVTSQISKNFSSFTVKSRSEAVVVDGVETYKYSNGVSVSVNIKQLTGRDDAPVIQLSGSNPQNVEVNTVYKEAGATASDTEDGNITSRITKVIKNASNGTVAAIDTTRLGTFTVIYSVTDSKGHTVSVNRTVNIVDTTQPTLTIKGDNPLTLSISDGDKWESSKPTVVAVDNYDGNITSKITESGSVNDKKAGTYTVTYSVKDSSGNVTNKLLTVKVVE